MCYRLSLPIGAKERGKSMAIRIFGTNQVYAQNGQGFIGKGNQVVYAHGAHDVSCAHLHLPGV